jgi:hypothetical protein
LQAGKQISEKDKDIERVGETDLEEMQKMIDLAQSSQAAQQHNQQMEWER